MFAYKNLAATWPDFQSHGWVVVLTQSHWGTGAAPTLMRCCCFAPAKDSHPKFIQLNEIAYAMEAYAICTAETQCWTIAIASAPRPTTLTKHVVAPK